MNNLIKNNFDLDFCKLKVNGKNNDWVFPGEDSIKNIKSLEIIDELCKGNVISTQTILMKKEIFNEIEFDEALPRFQDYDFVLRIAHKYKISFTDKILVNAFRQNDSISNSNNKLRKACILMLKKDYNLSQENEKTLNDTLIFWLFKTETDELKKNNSILKSDYQKLLDKCNKNLNDYKQLDNQYRSIINSRRWKLLNRIIKIFNE